MLLSIGQTFAAVTVYVDVRQTGPTTPAFGVLLTRVGKNVDAIYSVTAGYNGQPTLHAEEKITATAWTYTVSPVTDVTISPTSGNGSSATITAKSVEAGTYGIAVTFEVKFTITKYKADGTVDSTRIDGPYTGSGTFTLSVKNGKFNVFIEPKDMFIGQRNTLGIGEPAKVVVEKENVYDPPVEFDSMEAYENGNTLINVSNSNFVAGYDSGIAKIKVWAKINGVKEPETIGVSVIEPSGVTFEKVEKIPDPNPTLPQVAFAGFRANVYFLPSSVSFLNIEFNEGECPTQLDTGKYFSKLRNLLPHILPAKHEAGSTGPLTAGPTNDKHNKVNGADRVTSGICPSPLILTLLNLKRGRISN
jgi:hypothetical protein